MATNPRFHACVGHGASQGLCLGCPMGSGWRDLQPKSWVPIPMGPLPPRYQNSFQKYSFLLLWFFIQLGMNRMDLAIGNTKSNPLLFFEACLSIRGKKIIDSLWNFEIALSFWNLGECRKSHHLYVYNLDSFFMRD